MTGHVAFERLAATAVDFGISPAERDALQRHLDGCAECRRFAAGLVSDAETLRAFAVVASPTRVRAAVLGAATRPAPRRPVWQLLAAAMLLLALLGVAAVGVGALLQRGEESVSPITWQAIPDSFAGGQPTTGARLRHIAYGSGRYVVAVDPGPGPPFLWSADDLRWQAVEWTAEPITVTDLEWFAAGPGGGQFWAVGSIDDRPAAWWSVDGTSWTMEPLDDGTGVARALSAADGGIVAVGSVTEQIELEPGVFEPMTAGRVWERVGEGSWQVVGDVPAGEGEGELIDIATTDGGLVALGTGGGTLLVDGPAGWQRRGAGPAGNAFALEWGNGVLIALGNAADAPTVRVQGDWLWSPAELPEATAATATAVTFRDGRFVIVGSGPGGAMAWHSVDGRLWEASGTIPGGGGALMRDVVVDEQGFLVVGARGPDGVLWRGSAGATESEGTE
jgi:hypothetical protein